MSESKAVAPGTPLPWQRLRAVAFWTLAICAVLVGVLWMASYLSGAKYYRSHWFNDDSVTREKAVWLFSNGGGLAFARRTQRVVPMLRGPLPESEAGWMRVTPGEAIAISSGSGAAWWYWHGFHYHSETTPRGAGSSTTYRQVVIPYWFPFLVLVVAAALASGQRDRP